MRAVLVLALLAVPAWAQDPAPAAPAPPAVPQLVPPDPLPGKPLPEGAEWQTTASGLRYVVLASGDAAGLQPGGTDKVKVYYSGFLEDGGKVDERARPAQPIAMGVDEFIPGWSEALQRMRPGDVLKVHIPWQIAYGERGSPPKVPGRANLVFDMELVSFTPGPVVPKFSMPDPADLHTTGSGLQYAVLAPGREDGRKPVASDTVTVHYAGWFPDGRLFDSSYKREKPTTYPLSGFVRGWIEGLQLMREGAVYKFVIPPELGYGAKGRSGIPPNATLVFQIELIEVGA